MKKQYITDVTAAQVAAVLSYDPLTGLFTWAARNGGRSSVGATAGYVNRAGYGCIGINKREFKAHRLAWLCIHGRWPAQEIDHINGIRTDNRIANLREASRLENMHNVHAEYKNSMGVTGIRRTPSGRYSSRINVAGRSEFLGCFITPEEARAAYLAAKRERHTTCTI
jgi:hypothetical protein